MASIRRRNADTTKEFCNHRPADRPGPRSRNPSPQTGFGRSPQRCAMPSQNGVAALLVRAAESATPADVISLKLGINIVPPGHWTSAPSSRPFTDSWTESDADTPTRRSWSPRRSCGPATKTSLARATWSFCPTDLSAASPSATRPTLHAVRSPSPHPGSTSSTLSVSASRRASRSAIWMGTASTGPQISPPSCYRTDCTQTGRSTKRWVAALPDWCSTRPASS